MFNVLGLEHNCVVIDVVPVQYSRVVCARVSPAMQDHQIIADRYMPTRRGIIVLCIVKLRGKEFMQDSGVGLGLDRQPACWLLGSCKAVRVHNLLLSYRSV